MSNVLMICGSLRKGSFNRALMNALPALAPADMKLTEAPSFRGFPRARMLPDRDSARYEFAPRRIRTTMIVMGVALGGGLAGPGRRAALG
jgi:NAD(P)H-dependent FMN reductase